MPPKDRTTQFHGVFGRHIESLRKLLEALPDSVTLATSEDKITVVFSSLKVPDDDNEAWEIFDRRMNSLFGEELRDSSGRLLNFKRGPLGMDMVVDYLEACHKLPLAKFQWEAAMPKIVRLCEEAKTISNVTGSKAPKKKSKGSSAPKKAPAAPPKPKATKAKGRSKKKDDGGGTESEDNDYVPRKRGRGDVSSDSDALGEVFDSQGEEVTEESEHLRALNERRRAKKARLSKENEASDSGVSSDNAESTPKPKKKKRKGKKKAPTIVEINSDSESEGDSALNALDEDTGPRGPENMSRRHYLGPTPTKDKKGQPRWSWKCKYCRCCRTVARSIHGPDVKFEDESPQPGLQNLATHTSSCKARKAAEQKAAKRKVSVDDLTDEEAENLVKNLGFNLEASAKIMAKYLEDGQINPETVPTQKGFYRIFAAWILDESLPWTTGEAPSLRALFKYLKVHFLLPSDTTVRNYLAHIFNELHQTVVRELASVKSRISYSTDTWTTKQMVYSFACNLAFFIDDDWRLIERIVDFRPLESKDHEGINGAKHFMNLTTDNASSMETLVTEAARLILALYKVPFHTDNRIRCINHVFNLVSQSILSSLGEAEDPNSEDADAFLQTKDISPHYSADDDEDQAELEKERGKDLRGMDDPEELFDLLEREEVKNTKPDSALKRLRFLCTKICSSPQRRQQFYKISEELYASNPTTEHLALLMVVRDVRTRWNYTYEMIRRALMLRKAIDRWTLDRDEYCELMLTAGDWKLLEAIAEVLEPFMLATKEFSKTKQPTIPFVLPTYYQLKAHLNAVMTNTQRFDFSIRNAVAKGQDKLDKYLALAEKNQHYIIGTVLHPSLRSAWFASTQDTDQDKKAEVARIEALVRYTAEEHYLETPAPVMEATSTNGAPSTAPAVRRESSWMASLCSFPSPQPTATPNAPPLTPKERLKMELDRYFRFEGSRCETPDASLAWWKENAPAFPTLARMARDFLAIPATSVSVERIFSQSRHICTDVRSSLKAATISKALLSKVWIRSGLLSIPGQAKNLYAQD